MSSMLEHKDPHQVDDQTSHRDRKQPLVVDIRRLQGSLKTDRRTDRFMMSVHQWTECVCLCV